LSGISSVGYLWHFEGCDEKGVVEKGVVEKGVVEKDVEISLQ
jgi:hypothetical protein